MIKIEGSNREIQTELESIRNRIVIVIPNLYDGMLPYHLKGLKLVVQSLKKSNKVFFAHNQLTYRDFPLEISILAPFLNLNKYGVFESFNKQAEFPFYLLPQALKNATLVSYSFAMKHDKLIYDGVVSNILNLVPLWSIRWRDINFLEENPSLHIKSLLLHRPFDFYILDLSFIGKVSDESVDLKPFSRKIAFADTPYVDKIGIEILNIPFREVQYLSTTRPFKRDL